MRLFLFTDGACKANGRAGARAGWGWAAFLPGEERPVASDAAPLEVAPMANAPMANAPAGAEESTAPTNQRAELTAIIRALEWAAGRRRRVEPVVVSDSQYAIKTITVWGPAWFAPGFGAAKLARKKNLDLVRRAIGLARQTGAAFVHVNSHRRAPPPGVAPETRASEPPLEDVDTLFLWRGNRVADLAASEAAGREAASSSASVSSASAAPRPRKKKPSTTAGGAVGTAGSAVGTAGAEKKTRKSRARSEKGSSSESGAASSAPKRPRRPRNTSAPQS